jgi:hypothetical protein
MNRPNTREQGSQRIRQLLTAFPEVGELEGIRAWYASKKAGGVSPEMLSSSIVRMGVLLIRLGQLSADLMAEANDAYIYRKRKYSWEFTAMKGDLKISERENLASDKIQSEVDEELITRYIADHVKFLYDDFSRFVMILQSRLNTLRDERVKSHNEP